MANTNNMPANAQDDAPQIPLSEIGSVDTSVACREADTMDRFPIYGVKELTPGQVFGGEYINTVQRGKNDKGQPILAQVFRNRKSGAKFGFWGTGITNNYFRRVPQGAYVTVKYNGKAEKALKPGQSAPHDFQFLLETGRELLPIETTDAGASGAGAN